MQQGKSTGHFGILELALFNIGQDPKDSNVHPCCLITYSYHFLQCLFLAFYEKQNNNNNQNKPQTTKTSVLFFLGGRYKIFQYGKY